MDNCHALPTCVVTVTYGNRYVFLDAVVRAAVTAGAKRVVVVDNGASVESKRGILALSQELGEMLDVVTLDKNRGSAGGFKAGMVRAQQHQDCEFIWLLDDDNLANQETLARLWAAYRLLGNNKESALLSLREKLSQYKNASINGSPPAIRENSFYGFHVADLPRKFGKLWSRLVHAPKSCPKRIPLVPLNTAAYGGFFFHRDWLKKIGFPDERLFVDQDDLEYSGRMTEAGCQIYLCSTSELDDIDLSWYNRKISSHRWLVPEANEVRLYLLLRNHVFINKKRINYAAVYWMNTVIFLSALWLTAWLLEPSKRHLVRRFRIITRAILDGHKERLGPAPIL